MKYKRYTSRTANLCIGYSQLSQSLCTMKLLCNVNQLEENILRTKPLVYIRFQNVTGIEVNRFSSLDAILSNAVMFLAVFTVSFYLY